MKKNLKYFTLVLLMIFIVQMNVNAKLLITPTRIDLNDSNKMQSLKLINESNEQVTYRIGYKYQAMTPEGGYRDLTPDEQVKVAKIEEMVMYSPRQVTLDPKQTQTVRFALRRVEGFDGEINAHILFKEVEKTSQIAQLNKPKDGDFSIEIKPLFNIAIPVFVSNFNKNIKHKALIKNPYFDFNQKMLVFNVENYGQYSPYGKVTAKFYNGRKLLGQAELNGVSITMPLKERKVMLSLRDAQYNMAEISKIEISYDSTVDSGKSYNIATSIVTLQ